MNLGILVKIKGGTRKPKGEDKTPSNKRCRQVVELFPRAIARVCYK